MDSHEKKRPNVSKDAAKLFLEEKFRLRITKITDLPSYEDQNFKIVASDNSGYVARFYSPNAKKEAVEFETSVLSLLHRSGLPVAKLITSEPNAEAIQVYSVGALNHFVTMVTLIPGVHLEDVQPASDSLLREFGALLARLDQTMGTFQGPIVSSSVAWNNDIADQIIDSNLQYLHFLNCEPPGARSASPVPTSSPDPGTVGEHFVYPEPGEGACDGEEMFMLDQPGAAPRENDLEVDRILAEQQQAAQATVGESKEQSVPAWFLSADDLIRAVRDNYGTHTKPRLTHLRTSLIHGDANDQNVLVDPATNKVTGVIDFGDMTKSRLINNIAIAAVYCMIHFLPPLSTNVFSALKLPTDKLQSRDAIAAIPFVRVARLMVQAYTSTLPLQDDEIKVVFPLMRARLALSLSMAARNASLDPSNAHAQIANFPKYFLLNCLHRLSDDVTYSLLKEHV